MRACVALVLWPVAVLLVPLLVAPLLPLTTSPYLPAHVNSLPCRSPPCAAFLPSLSVQVAHSVVVVDGGSWAPPSLQAITVRDGQGHGHLFASGVRRADENFAGPAGPVLASAVQHTDPHHGATFVDIYTGTRFVTENGSLAHRHVTEPIARVLESRDTGHGVTHSQFHVVSNDHHDHDHAGIVSYRIAARKVPLEREELDGSVRLNADPFHSHSLHLWVRMRGVVRGVAVFNRGIAQLFAQALGDGEWREGACEALPTFALHTPTNSSGSVYASGTLTRNALTRLMYGEGVGSPFAPNVLASVASEQLTRARDFMASFMEWDYLVFPVGFERQVCMLALAMRLTRVVEAAKRGGKQDKGPEPHHALRVTGPKAIKRMKHTFDALTARGKHACVLVRMADVVQQLRVAKLDDVRSALHVELRPTKVALGGHVMSSPLFECNNPDGAGHGRGRGRGSDGDDAGGGNGSAGAGAGGAIIEAAAFAVPFRVPLSAPAGPQPVLSLCPERMPQPLRRAQDGVRLRLSRQAVVHSCAETSKAQPVALVSTPLESLAHVSHSPVGVDFPPRIHHHTLEFVHEVALNNKHAAFPRLPKSREFVRFHTHKAVSLAEFLFSHTPANEAHDAMLAEGMPEEGDVDQHGRTHVAHGAQLFRGSEFGWTGASYAVPASGPHLNTSITVTLGETSKMDAVSGRMRPHTGTLDSLLESFPNCSVHDALQHVELEPGRDYVVKARLRSAPHFVMDSMFRKMAISHWDCSLSVEDIKWTPTDHPESAHLARVRVEVEADANVNSTLTAHALTRSGFFRWPYAALGDMAERLWLRLVGP